MSEPKAEQKLLDDELKKFMQTPEPPKIPMKPSELVAEVLEIDLQQQLHNAPSPIQPFMHGLMCGLKLCGR